MKYLSVALLWVLLGSNFVDGLLISTNWSAWLFFPYVACLAGSTYMFGTYITKKIMKD